MISRKSSERLTGRYLPETIFPRDIKVFMDDGSSEKISKIANFPSTIPGLKFSKWISSAVKFAIHMGSNPSFQSCVFCKVNLRGLHTLEPKTKFLGSHGITVANDVLYFDPERPFRILVSSISKFQYLINKIQKIFYVRPVTNFTLVPVSITRDYMLVITKTIKY